MNERKWRVSAVLGGIVGTAILIGVLRSGDCTTRTVACASATHPCHLSALITAGLALCAMALAAAQFATVTKRLSAQRTLTLGSVACFALVIVSMAVFPGICADPASVCQSTQALTVPAAVVGLFVTGIMLASTKF